MTTNQRYKRGNLMNLWNICFALAFYASTTFAYPSLEGKLKDGREFTLVALDNIETNLEPDLKIGIEAFAGAYSQSDKLEMVAHFGEAMDVRAFYARLFQEDDVLPFRENKMLWIRAFINDKLIGWMTLENNFREEGIVYISKLAITPAYQNQGLGSVFLSSIHSHWYKKTKELDLIVSNINGKAIDFYLHHGFEFANDIKSEIIEEFSKCSFMRKFLKTK